MKQLGKFLFYRYKFKYFKKYGNQKFLMGFTLIESIVGIALMLVIFLGIFGIAQLSFRVIAQSKARITASATANQKIEWIRNLSYNDIGTLGGIPPGIIPQTEMIIKNNIQYTVRTVISYIDDPFDGLAPDDPIPNDYKRIKVEVSWQSGTGGEVFIITDVSPKGLETSVGSGNLLITVFNATGAAISLADIYIINTAVNPPIDVYYQTNNEGKYLIAGAPASVENYQITVSKSGYSVDRTYGTEEVVNPEKSHVTVIEGELTQASFSIDELGSFSIDTFAQLGLESFSDSFIDQSKISEINNIVVSGGAAVLADSITINNGAASTNTTNVTLNLTATDNIGVTGYYVSESSITPLATDSGWTSITSTINYSANVSFTLSSGNGTKTVYAWYKDAAGNVSPSYDDSIILE